MSKPDFKPVFTRPWKPEYEHLSKEELIALLPKSIRYEIRRVEWAWKNLNQFAKRDVVLPGTQQEVSELEFTREDIKYLFDPDISDFEGIWDTEEEKWLAYVNHDPVLFARVYLEINPRVYQIIILRDPHPRKALRLGRRCGKTTTLTIRALWRSYTIPGNKTLLIAPMKSHLGVTWEMIDELYQNSPELVKEFNSEEFRRVETPHYFIKFSNGSTIKCFTSGVRSKSKGDSIRGQEGDDLYVDEIDLMSVDDLPAFTSIIRDTDRGRGEKMMIVASTPNGRRDMLYAFCTEMSITADPERGFKEYFFPAHADINYSPLDDREQQRLLIHNRYVQEILADFGEESTGVFMKKQLERALSHIPEGYDYIHMDEAFVRDSYSKIVVGVDWDKFGAGTNIVVCSWDVREKDDRFPDHGRLKIIARFEVPRSMTTLRDGVDMIKNVNAKFNPDLIFVDRGYGEMQLEELLFAGKNTEGDVRAVGLDKKVKGIAFNQAIEIFDPLTKQKVKKEIKDHMVTLSVKMFEEDNVILNEEDQTEVHGCTSPIQKQMEQYLQVGVSVTGKPRYEAGDELIGDHALDGFMLCVLAIDQEWGLFSTPQLANKAIPMKKSLSELTGHSKMEPRDFAKADEEDIPPSKRQIKRSVPGSRKLRSLRGNNGRSIKRTIMRGR